MTLRVWELIITLEWWIILWAVAQAIVAHLACSLINRDISKYLGRYIHRYRGLTGSSFSYSQTIMQTIAWLIKSFRFRISVGPGAGRNGPQNALTKANRRTNFNPGGIYFVSADGDKERGRYYQLYISSHHATYGQCQVDGNFRPKAKMKASERSLG